MYRFVSLVAIGALLILSSAMYAQSPTYVYSDGSVPLEPMNSPPPVIFDDFDDSQTGMCDSSGCHSGTACDACGGRQGRLSAWDRCKCRQQAKWWGYPEEFNELPLGVAVNSALELQVARAKDARLTLYDYDFVDGAPTLKHRGRTRVKELAKLAKQCGGTITIESTRSDLDSQRLFAIQAMATDSLGLHPDQIAVASPMAAGIDGEQASIIRQNHLEHVRQYGVREFNFGSFSPQRGGSWGISR
jgi:hypothetical protein